MPARSDNNPALSRFAWLTAFATLVLICFGGLVTSHGAGLAVPDWPNTYGYNLFFFPISKWVGGIFYEHTHRLIASGVGLLTVVLAVWIWRRDSRAWVRWLGLLALIGVVLQGVLGGLRVTLVKDELGIVHAMIAQLFLALVAAIALFTSASWRERIATPVPSDRLRTMLCLATGLVFVQLIVGATMRHQHAGLAIPDFPLAYGRLWPATDPASVAAYNQHRVEVNAANPITAPQIWLQMAHRLLGLGILAAVAFCARRAVRELGWGLPLARGTVVWLGLTFIQAGLGAASVWTGKSADIATAHVAVGATVLVTGCLLALRSARACFPATSATPETRAMPDAGGRLPPTWEPRSTTRSSRPSLPNSSPANA